MSIKLITYVTFNIFREIFDFTDWGKKEGDTLR